MAPRLLLSARARDALAGDIAAARGGRALEVVTLEDAADDPCIQVHAAYVSRDVTGLSMLGLHVAVARHSAEPAGPGQETVRYAELPALLPRAQWLLLACPLSAETRGLVDADALARLPQGAMLVNVARGEVVDEAALVDALQRGHLGGAFLDVHAHEPLPEASPLWSLPDVWVTPHSAGQSAGNAARTAAMFVERLGRWLRGEPLAEVAR